MMAKILRKWLLIGLAIVLLAGFGAVIGCASNVEVAAGKYVNQDDSSEYVEIKADGTYLLKMNGGEFMGEWEVKGNEIRFYREDELGMVRKAAGTVEGNIIHDYDGIVWVLEE